ncbi:hypothetical protein [Streptomyces sp. NBC_01481]|uniref:hypothetical protein n=1 Tax=Streptomyces sp. NBC_01481 TaxID=2975869 RepID=UPI002250C6BE|nr:hypothetical protein [Streptomyces sp. NBC_01481]MCX4581839.1 hypothetical protein [Streptomyces sp. NBC_01481]
MHPDVHRQLHSIRADELRGETAEVALRPRRAPIRTQLGLVLVELGLRLMKPPARRQARIA